MSSLVTHSKSPGQQQVLSGEQIKHYREMGYTLIRGLIPAEELAVAREILLKIDDGDCCGIVDDQFHHAVAFKNDRRGKIIAGVQSPAKSLPVFDAIAGHHRLKTAMQELLGGPVTRYTDQCGIKSFHIKTAQGGQTFYHQDSNYWRIAPEQGCNCWIPFDDVGPDSSALAVIPQSHAGWIMQEHELYLDDPPLCSGRSAQPFKRRRIPLDRVDYSKELLIPMKAGDGLFFTNYTWHRSEKNKSGKTKCFYAIAFQKVCQS